MRLHPSVVENLLRICANYGGHKDEKRLLSHLEQQRLSLYFREAGVILVDTAAYINERRARKQPENDIIPMRFHSTALEKMLYVYNMYSGHSNEGKLRAAFSALDFTAYEQRSTGETVLVLTEHYTKVCQGS